MDTASTSTSRHPIRRKILLACGAAALSTSFRAFAQQGQRARRIGYMATGTVQANAPWIAAFRQGMSALGWSEGRDYLIDARYANGVPQAMEGLVAELLAAQPEVLLTPSDVGARLLAQKAPTLPIVLANGQDFVGNGLAKSLRRPGGNVTGLTSLGAELSAKRLQLLHEAFPRIARIALLFESDSDGSLASVRVTEESATRLKIRVDKIDLRQAPDIEAAFNRGAALGAHAYVVAQGTLVNIQLQAVVEASIHSRLPAIFSGDQYANAGGLMSYAPSFPDNFRRAATYVDKILKGAKPGDLPIEQPTKFALVVNMKTARALKLTIPQTVLLRADRVIE